MIVNTAQRLTGDGSYPLTRTPALSPNTVSDNFLVNRDIAPMALPPVKQTLRLLWNWEANWDGYGSVKPNREAILRTEALLPELLNVATNAELGWLNPHVSASEDGNVVLEWWHDTRKVTVYVGANETSYLRVWGENPETEMDDGVIRTTAMDFARIWAWLNP